MFCSVQHRWERVVARSAERTRALDHGYKEAREFHDAWYKKLFYIILKKPKTKFYLDYY